MKLKKIASLMLAGVMAVSMLAGCSTVSETPEEPNDDQQEVVVSAAADMLYNELSGSAKARVTAVANDDLDKALANAADKYWDYNSTASIDKLTEVNWWNAGKALKSAMSANYTSINDFWNNDTSKKSMVKLYVVDASNSDAYVMEMVADKLDRGITKLPEATMREIYNDYTYSYTVSASIATKTVTFAGVDMGIKYVAVYMTQTPTENA